MSPFASPSTRANAVFAALTVLAIALYWQGLYGQFVFDDLPFVVNNAGVHVAESTLGNWIRAAGSFPAGHQGRWLTMLTFAANYYFAGLDPFWLKLTNLAIHVCNGGLLYALLRALFALRATASAAPFSTARANAVAAIVAGAWLLLPINVTAVLYVTQRLESFCTIFILAGLLFYVRARQRHFSDGGSRAALWSSLAVLTAAGLLAKESAVLLPLFALCIELTITRGRNADGRRSRTVVAIYVALLVVPLLIGLAWLATWVGGSTSYDRPFTTAQRLWTEMRVLIDYLRWTLLPLPNELSFYHDDIALSTGWLTPLSTLWSALALAVLALAAVLARKTHPLFSLGILWFFAGHALTATVIPLELAFEHRNYFPAIGLLLACASLAALEPGLKSLPVRATIATAAIALFAANTYLRAEEWSDPLKLAVAEAAKRPLSPRAQYGLADTLMSYATSADSELVSKSIDLLHIASTLPNAGITGEQGLIIYASALKRPVDPGWWTRIDDKLRASPPSESDIVGLRALLRCQLRGLCQNQTEPLMQAFLAALSHPHPRAPLLASYADFAAVRMNDNALAERLLLQAIETDPREPFYRSNLVRLQIAEGELDRARSTFAELERLNHWGSLDAMLDMLRGQLAEATRPPHDAPPKNAGDTP